ncbi:MAG: glycosyltransferase family 39 protein [bacterium]|nr:glycosyltransferase family 39 protein [bacterium]
MRKKFLIFIFALSFIIRFWELGKNPPSLNWDEIAFGYNAYSLLQTGKDEYGKPYPVFFNSFNDSKHPVYVYATYLSIMFFGKNEFAIRYPSALFGSLTVISVYFLTKQLLVVSKKNQAETQSEKWPYRAGNIAALSTLLFAISPWHVHFSRVAFEANIGLFFFVSGTYLFLIYCQAKQKLIILLGSALLMALAIYSYTSYRLLVPMLLIGYIIPYFNIFKKNWKHFVVCTIFALISSSAILLQMYSGSGLDRFIGTSIFHKMEYTQRNKLYAKEDFDAGLGRFSSLVHNFRTPIIQRSIDNYLSHYNFSFLFTFGDLPRHQVPGFGLLYIWQFPLIIIGLIFLIKNRAHLNIYLPLWCLFIALVPVSLTWPVPHSIRSLLMLPILSLLSGAGLWASLKWIQVQDLKLYSLPNTTNIYQEFLHKLRWIFPKTLLLTIFSIISLSFISLLISYNVHLKKEYSQYWLYGRKEMVEYVEASKGKYDNITVSLSLDWAYLWFLWYGNYSPQSYIDKGGTVSGGFAETQNTVGKIKFKPFEFAPTEFGNIKLPENSLYIGTPKDFPTTIVPEKTIYDLRGKPTILIIKT